MVETLDESMIDEETTIVGEMIKKRAESNFLM